MISSSLEWVNTICSYDWTMELNHKPSTEDLINAFNMRNEDIDRTKSLLKNRNAYSHMSENEQKLLRCKIGNLPNIGINTLLNKNRIKSDLNGCEWDYYCKQILDVINPDKRPDLLIDKWLKVEVKTPWNIKFDNNDRYIELYRPIDEGLALFIIDLSNPSSDYDEWDIRNLHYYFLTNWQYRKSEPDDDGRIRVVLVFPRRQLTELLGLLRSMYRL